MYKKDVAKKIETWFRNWKKQTNYISDVSLFDVDTTIVPSYAAPQDSNDLQNFSRSKLTPHLFCCRTSLDVDKPSLSLQ